MDGQEASKGCGEGCGLWEENKRLKYTIAMMQKIVDNYQAEINFRANSIYSADYRKLGK